MSNTVNWAIVPLTITAKTARSFYGMLVTRKGVEYLAVKESRKGALSLAYYGKDKASFEFGRRTRGASEGEIDVSLLSGRFEPVAFALTLAGEGVTAHLGHKVQSSKARVAFGDGAGAAEAPTMADLMASLATAAAPPTPAPEAAPEPAPEPEALPSLEVIAGAIEAVEGQIEATKQGKVLAAQLGMSLAAFEAKEADLTLALADLKAKAAKAEAAAAAAAAELEADAVEAFVLTAGAIAARWGDAAALLSLAKQAGVEVGRTRSAAGLGGLLMAALQ